MIIPEDWYQYTVFLNRKNNPSYLVFPPWLCACREGGTWNRHKVRVNDLLNMCRLDQRDKKYAGIQSDQSLQLRFSG